jgi:hypothetical protein
VRLKLESTSDHFVFPYPSRLQREEPVARLVRAFDAHLEKLHPGVPFEDYFAFEISKVFILQSGISGFKFAMHYRGVELTQTGAQTEAGLVVNTYLRFLRSLDPRLLDVDEVGAAGSA